MLNPIRTNLESMEGWTGLNFLVRPMPNCIGAEPGWFCPWILVWPLNWPKPCWTGWFGLVCFFFYIRVLVSVFWRKSYPVTVRKTGKCGENVEKSRIKGHIFLPISLSPLPLFFWKSVENGKIRESHAKFFLCWHDFNICCRFMDNLCNDTKIINFR